MWSIKNKESIQPKGIKPGPHKKGYSSDSDGKESTCNLEDLGPIPGLGSFPGEENGNPLQYSCLVNPMDRGAWWAPVHGVTKELDMT